MVSKSNQEYKPKEPILACLPLWLVPYAELVRIHQPLGYYLISTPFVAGVAYTALIAPSQVPTALLLNRFLLLSIWSVLFRSASCVWNDIIDLDLDQQIARTKTRPLIRGAVSTSTAVIFTAAIYLLGFSVLTFLPRSCTVDALFMVFWALVYPFGKRFTYYPQLILGFSGWAIPMAMHSLDVDPLVHFQAALSMVAYFALLIVMLDTIYAIQDMKEDMQVGVKSMAVRFRKSLNLLLSSLFYASTIALLVAGLIAGMGLPFFTLSVGGHLCRSFFVLKVVKQPSSSSERYARSACKVGTWLLLSGLAVECCMRSYV
ncbi:hypothetical protein ASPWEDRAFT_56941 [Aspergillus wentii DTO 134E9]|uniref:4-hydroxybenzoate polyprenyltransferase, mitochondrial n=1 Tax=Aspergillus wentii DTO 134E9 TaxID=1073089 RepID=A0A1L9RT95_ASPWE|nr:uncharacterized protein ASPWEDRAFT_56941 [Aspergillus wentii DTO 134E9]KAI9933737.1 hypothetical protein MW887_004809 [Aspergillus wentii]OJJ38078.1 hypothetical protein ASPWEDRAFT_56941 [Aspergillus wentii DTO 134E9]